MKETLSLISVLLSFCLILSGCNSVATCNFEVSQTVLRSSIQETESPKELGERSLVLIFAPYKGKHNIKLQHKDKADYGEALIDSDSFAAWVVPAGKYTLNTKTEATINPGGCYFFTVSNGVVSPISFENFKKSFAEKYMVKQSQVYGDVRTVEDFFTCKVSGAEAFGHDVGVIIGYIGVAIAAILVVAIFVAMMRSGHSPRLYSSPAPHGQVKPNAYGPGIHSDQYGRPVKIAPAY